jgi:serine/threonine protein kinase
VKLLDFGIAKPSKFDVNEDVATLTGTIMGTPQYMSPEQASGQRVLDHRTDIWSFAIMAFECLTGCQPFHANTLGGLVLAICVGPLPVPSKFGAVPAGFDEWFARAAHRDIDGRFGTMTETAEQLRVVCGVDAPASGRNNYPYDNTLQSDGRTTANGHTRVPQLPADPRHTTSAPSVVTALPRAASHTRRSRAIWMSGILIAVGVAIGAVGSTHDAATQTSPSPFAVSSSGELRLPSPPPTHSSGPLVTPVPDPTTTRNHSAASVRVPMGIPMPPRPAESAKSFLMRSIPSASAPTPVTIPPVPHADCDPVVKARIGFCPSASK